MDTISKKGFADLCGISKAAIGKACKEGRIATTGEGRTQKVNLSDRLTKSFQRLQASKVKPDKKILPFVQDVDAVLPPDRQLSLLPMSDINAIDRSQILNYDKPDLEKLKLFEQAKLENIKVAEKEGTLINRDLVKKIFAKIYTVDTEQLRTLEDILTPEICEIFGEQDDSDNGAKVRGLINKKIMNALEHIKRIIDEHLVLIESQKL